MKDYKSEPKILIISTIACSYPGIDNAGQKHLEYSPNSYVILVPDPVIFPVSFYIKAFEMGYDGIFIAGCGDETPYKGAYEKFSKRIDETYAAMKEKGIDLGRLKPVAICTVCADHFVHGLKAFNENLKKINDALTVKAK